MPAYHSSFNDYQGTIACGCALLPLKTKVKGPAPQADPNEPDIIDEVLKYFKANVLFRNYEVKGPADRVLLYLTFYTHLCLTTIDRKKCKTKDEADKVLFQLAQSNFKSPGEPGFILGGYCPAGKTSAETAAWQKWFQQAREELGLRLIEKVFEHSTDGPNKFWMQFTKKKFLNKTMTA